MNYNAWCVRGAHGGRLPPVCAGANITAKYMIVVQKVQAPDRPPARRPIDRRSSTVDRRRPPTIGGLAAWPAGLMASAITG